LVNPVRSAVKAGVPVVVFDSDLKSDQQVSFVATDNFQGGRIAGQHVAALLNGKGKVILLRYQVGSASTEAREAGFLDALKEHRDIRLVSSDQYAGPTRETAYQASQNLLNRHGQDVDAVFCPNETSTIAKFIDKRGAGLQQLAFRVSDLDTLSDRLRGQGVRLLYDAPRRGTANSRINFIHPKDAGGVLVELVEPGQH
jgi:ribose transport system substrate-binding protein